MHNIDKSVVQEFLERQIRDWDTAKNNYEALKHVKVKEFELNGSTVKVQFNPARIVSSAAKVDAKSLKERKCFLCEANRPAVQEGLPWEDYTILVNPFPIFPKHLTIPANEHTPQLIAGRISDMMKIARVLESYVVFYNGPKCGASAPDHMHFQAGNVGFMPVGRWIALDGKMGEPAVWSRPVPMHHVRCYFDHITCFKPPRRFAFLLIVALTTDTDKQLSPSMAVPVVAASRLESHVRYRYIQFLHGGQRSQP